VEKKPEILAGQPADSPLHPVYLIAGAETLLVQEAADAVRAQASLQLVGLMTMAPELGPTVPADAVRHCFAMVRAIAEQHGLARLSMGMSGDYELAVAEGATEVRIGTFLFS
jgi:uncharacterized pyridoxal phosphate-containing UPF0001 family protein